MWYTLGTLDSTRQAKNVDGEIQQWQDRIKNLVGWQDLPYYNRRPTEPPKSSFELKPDDLYTAEEEVPGWNKKDLVATIEEDVLKIHGVKTDNDKKVIDLSLSLPLDLDRDTLSIKLEDGLLGITASIVKKPEGRTIEIK